MATIYKKYLELDINGQYLGLEPGEYENHYFCTPKGARIIGWAGVDGIHYCFVRGFGEMVFAVSPMNTSGDYVHLLSKNFKDFLRLLLACGHTSALEQAWCWDQVRFDEFLLQNSPTAQQTAVLDLIRNKLSITPMEQPFIYMKNLQDLFDYSRFKYTEAPSIPEWKVYYEGNFWGHDRHERPGKEVFLNKQFVWDHEVWTILGIYLCSSGLVVDLCLQVPLERIRTFTDQWKLSADSDETDFTDEQRMQIDRDNPLDIDIKIKAVLNGTEHPCSHGCGLSWNPCFPEGNSLVAEHVIQHYGLDPAKGYAVSRSSFPWKTKCKPQIKRLSIKLAQEPVAVPGPHFQTSLPDGQIEFIYSPTGKKHTLTVQEYEQQEISSEDFHEPNQEFPSHYTVMSYTLSPDLPARFFSVTDCVSSDRPRYRHTGPHASGATSDVCSIGIIGSADAPTSIAVRNGNQSNVRTACSSLHFDSPEYVEWRMVFYQQECQDIEVPLI